MAGYVFLGRQRNPVKMLVFQLLTLGVYGRVYLYKILRDLDGHEALFLDRRPYIPLLILPFIGPLLVKRKVNRILADLVHHDVTTPRYAPRKLAALAWVPLVPLYHLELQRLLNHHWGMHRKELELELKRAHLAALQRSRREEALKASQALAKEVQLREKELEDVRQAALALREAEHVRMEAERDAGRKRSRNPMALVRKLSAAAAARLPRRGSAQALEERPAPTEETVAPARKGKKDLEPEPEPEPARDEASGPGAEPEPILEEGKAKKDPEEPAAEAEPTEKPKKDWRSFLPFLGKKSAEERPAKAARDGKKPKAKGRKEGDVELSRAERKELRRKEKEKTKAAKIAAKEKKKVDKIEAKEAKRAAKEEAKSAKREAKEKAKAAKEEAKEKAKAEKEKAKASDKKKGKPADKKQKSTTKASARASGAKPKGRSK